MAVCLQEKIICLSGRLVCDKDIYRNNTLEHFTLSFSQVLSIDGLWTWTFFIMSAFHLYT